MRCCAAALSWPCACCAPGPSLNPMAPASLPCVARTVPAGAPSSGSLGAFSGVQSSSSSSSSWMWLSSLLRSDAASSSAFSTALLAWWTTAGVFAPASSAAEVWRRARRASTASPRSAATCSSASAARAACARWSCASRMASAPCASALCATVSVNSWGRSTGRVTAATDDGSTGSKPNSSSSSSAATALPARRLPMPTDAAASSASLSSWRS
mmetsp:Transcript_12067/g.35913  ORF Transcript_12067/g.35913 Transcript_12067/m.35913 type:complete len:213 (+) Transcript_12067:450-1088(+)